MAILAGLVLLMPGFFALFHGSAAGTVLPVWLVRDLIGASVSGLVLVYFGAMVVRQRELRSHRLHPQSIRSRG